MQEKQKQLMRPTLTANERRFPAQENRDGKPFLEEVPRPNGGSSAREERGEELARILKEHSGESHLVILLGTPDPDAISSGMALTFLGARYDIETTLLCFVKPSHQENRALVKRLGIDLVQYVDGFDISEYSCYSIVDSQKFHTPIDKQLEEHHLKFLAFIDHHKEEVITPAAEFVDVRQHAASTAAILCEYMRNILPKGLEPNDPEHVKLATALVHGLRSDTHKFLLGTKLEFEAAAYLSPCVDSSAIEMIEHQVISSGVLGMFENALVRRRVHDNFIFSDVGFVRSADRDGIPQAAELLLQREGTDTVLVVGIVDEKMIDGSFRTRNERINPDEFLKGFLGSSPESGRYYGGGNIRDRGGFQIPLGFLAIHEDKNQVYAMALEVIEKSFLEYIGKASSEE